MEDKISYIKSSDRSISINSSYLLEMLPIECLQKDAIISDLEVKEHNKIIIKELSSNILNGKTLYINAKGLINEGRNKNNGIIMFGDNSKDEKDEYINDFVINLKSIDIEKSDNENNDITNTLNSSDNKNNNHLLFMIYYRRDIEDYFFHFNNKIIKYYCFASIVGPHLITTGCIISTINDNFKFSIDDDNKLKVDHSLPGGKVTSKTLSNKEDIKYYGGRKKDNEFYINDNAVSRIHFTIFYKQNQWFVVDGDCIKSSLSGTWIYVQKPIKIKNGLQVKICNSTLLFEVENVNK